MPSIASISEQYSTPKDTVYLDTASFGLTSAESVSKAAEFLEQQQKLGSSFVDRFRNEKLPEIRKTVSNFLDAELNELAFIPNFSFGMSAILASLQGLRRVLLFKDDYPSLLQPFLLNDYKVFWMESEDSSSFDLESIKNDILQHDIEIVAISQVQYLTGVAIDIESLGKICQEYGVVLIVDGTQSLGAMPFSFRSSSCDVFIASNYKWMNAGHGTGILCVKEEILERFPPKIGGFNSYQFIDNSWQYSSSIHSYEPGHLNFLGLLQLKSALEDKMQIGMRQIHAHIQELVANLKIQLHPTRFEVLNSNDDENGSSIVSFEADEKLYSLLTKQGIVLRMRGGILRVGIHFYNSQDDVDRLVEVLKQYDPL